MLSKFHSFLFLSFISTFVFSQKYGGTAEQTLNDIKRRSSMSRSVQHEINVIHDNGEIAEIVVNIQRDRNMLLGKYVSYEIHYYIEDGIYNSKMEQYINVSYEELSSAYKQNYSEYLLEENESGVFLSSTSYKSVMWIFLNPTNNAASILYNPVNEKTNPDYLIKINGWKKEKEEKEAAKLKLEKEKRERETKRREESERQQIRKEKKLDKPYHQRTNVPVDRHSEEAKSWLLIIKFKGDEVWVKKREDLHNKGSFGPYYGKPSKKFTPDKAMLFMINEAIKDKEGTHELYVYEIKRVYQPNPDDYIRYNYK